MLSFEDILRGYSQEQYSEALYHTLANYLAYKGIIDIKELGEFQQDNFSKVLEKIIERDREESKKKYEEYKAKES